MGFNTSEIPDLSGKVFIVTGGNSGVGYESARELALHNGRVIIATHAQDPSGPTPADEVDGPTAVSKILSEKSDATVEYMELDLASFRSIHKFVQDFKTKGLPLHCLINNAGLQTPPSAKTEDGFEITLGVNFWGPFYLTQQLLPLLQRSSGFTSGAGDKGATRIVWVSSPDEVLGETDWSDLKGSNLDSTMRAYGTSKLWDLMIAMEMNERLKGTGVESFACHPGMCRTDLFRKADHDKMASVITDWAQWIGGQTAASGALSLLYCATAPELEGKGGTYYGAYYKGPITLNILNTSSRTPGNAEANDPDARAKLYDKAMQIIKETSSKFAGEGEVLGPQADIRSAVTGPGAGTEAGGTGLAAAGDIGPALEAAKRAAAGGKIEAGVAGAEGGVEAAGGGDTASAVKEALAGMSIAGGPPGAAEEKGGKKGEAQERTQGAAAAPAGVSSF